LKAPLIKMPKTSKKENKKEKKVKKVRQLPQSPKGMHDILPEDQPLWERIRNKARSIAGLYGFSRIDTHIVEKAEIFERGVGQESEIVQKQMFYIKTPARSAGGKDDDRLVLQPEGTASVMRSYFENGLSRMGQPVKLYYEAPMFRHEQPQQARFRQFYQFGIEILGGENEPAYDAQAMLIPYKILESLKVKNITIKINSIGCHNCRGNFLKKLQQYYKRHQKDICKDCEKRISVNPMRLLDCKNEKCQPIKAGAPVILDFLCSQCKVYFKKVMEFADELRLPYVIDHLLVRGLDYYNRTVFEIFSEKSPLALVAGGRYDYLSEMLGQGRIAAVGSSIGLNRVAGVLKEEVKGVLRSRPKVFLIHLGDEAKKKGLGLIQKLVEEGISIGESFGRESLKSQLRMADKEKALLALIIGQKEVFEESVIVREMSGGVQETVPLTKIIEDIKKRLK